MSEYTITINNTIAFNSNITRSLLGYTLIIIYVCIIYNVTQNILLSKYDL